MGVDRVHVCILQEIKFMRYRAIATIVFTGLILVMNIASAQQKYDKPNEDVINKVRSGSVGPRPPKVTTEFGLGVGARYNWFEVQPISQPFTPNIKMQMSFGAALQFRLNIGRVFGIQPEISYAHAKLKISDPTYKLSTKVKSNLVQIPLLLSLRVAMFRINAGPVFTLMDSPTYLLVNPTDDSIVQQYLGKLYPTVTYTAGISVKFAKCVILDLRYADQFRDIKSENSYIGSLDKTKQSEAQRFRTRSRSVQLRIGYAF